MKTETVIILQKWPAFEKELTQKEHYSDDLIHKSNRGDKLNLTHAFSFLTGRGRVLLENVFTGGTKLALSEINGGGISYSSYGNFFLPVDRT